MCLINVVKFSTNKIVNLLDIYLLYLQFSPCNSNWIWMDYISKSIKANISLRFEACNLLTKIIHLNKRLHVKNHC